MGVYEPMKSCVIFSGHRCISLGLQFIVFISSQRLRTGLVQATHQTVEKTTGLLEEKGPVKFP